MNPNIAFLATDVGRLFRKRFDMVSRQFGVTGPQWRMLNTLNRTPGLKQAELAAILEVEAITAGRMIDRLERSGLVGRHADPDDRRVWRLHLTDQAQDLMSKLKVCGEAVLAEATRDFSAADQDRLQSLLGRVRANLLAELGEAVEAVHG